MSIVRRRFLQAIAAAVAFALVRRETASGDETVEVGGWILKRSDLT